MILYHGSDNIVEKPQYGHGKKNNDYGQGFYCTEDLALASEWACKDERGGFVNTYRLDTQGLDVFDLSERNIVSWLSILLFNRQIRYSNPVEKQAAEYMIRHFLPDITKHDVIRGYRADDSYFSYARAFLSNTISIQQLSKAMKFGNLGIQIFIQSKKAFEQLTFVESGMVPGNIFYPRRLVRDKNAREEYNRLLENAWTEGVFIRDMIREGMMENDLRI